MALKYEYGTPENRAFLRDQLGKLLAFGRHFPSPDGSAWYLQDDGQPWKEKDRMGFETSRMAHTYCMGGLLWKAEGEAAFANVKGADGSVVPDLTECETLTDEALKGLNGSLKDETHGGWYPGLTQTGEALPGKECYAHAFVILAASSALLLGRPGAKELLEEAVRVYDNYFWDEEEGMASDTWNTEFTVCDPYRGLNANMHSVEAFLAAADAAGEEKYRRRAGRIIDRVIGWAGKNQWRIPEHYTQDWQPDLMRNQDKPDDQFKPFGATPGHGIEWSRLIAQYAYAAYPEEEAKRTPYVQAARSLYERAVADAWNADGAPGLVYTTDWDGKPVVHDRMHWVLAEAINTSAVLYAATREERYAKDYAAFMQYLDELVIDHAKGSWFHQLDRENHLIGTVWPGKLDLYHAAQAMLIPYEEIGASIAKALAQRA